MIRIFENFQHFSGPEQVSFSGALIFPERLSAGETYAHDTTRTTRPTHDATHTQRDPRTTRSMHTQCMHRRVVRVRRVVCVACVSPAEETLMCSERFSLESSLRLCCGCLRSLALYLALTVVGGFNHSLADIVSLAATLAVQVPNTLARVAKSSKQIRAPKSFIREYIPRAQNTCAMYTRIYAPMCFFHSPNSSVHDPTRTSYKHL